MLAGYLKYAAPKKRINIMKRDTTKHETNGRNATNAALIMQFADNKTTASLCENIPITETTDATIVVNSSNPPHTMEIDYGGYGKVASTDAFMILQAGTMAGRGWGRRRSVCDK